MMMGRRRQPQPSPPEGRGVIFGWRTHGAITDWTAKVDTKASIVLSVGGVLLGFFVTLSASHRVLSNLHRWRLLVERFGLGFTAFGVLLAALVVIPRLYRRQAKKIWKDNFIYFGHLRHWEPQKLHKRLRDLTEDEELTVLANQLVSTSKIAWYKHSLLQAAMASILAGVLLVFISVVWP